MKSFLLGKIAGFVDNHAHNWMAESPVKNIQEFVEIGGKYVLEVAVNLKALRKVQDLYTTSDLKNVVKLAYGIHPEYFKPLYALLPEEQGNAYADTDTAIEHTIEGFVACNKCDNSLDPVVLGEVGLDIYRLNVDDISRVLTKQEEYLGRMLDWAVGKGAPVMFHIRGKSNNDMSMLTRLLDILKQYVKGPGSSKFYVHSFTGDVSIARHFVSLGVYLGINGIITYSSGRHLHDVVRYVPDELLLIETDAPFLKPDIKKSIVEHGGPELKEAWNKLENHKSNTSLSALLLNEYVQWIKTG